MNKQRNKHDHSEPIDLGALFSDGYLTTPVERAEIRAERAAERAREVRYRCAWGTCVNFYDPVKRRITWGVGRIGCPCDNLPGWKARHPLMLPKPNVPIKARGRAGSRVQRSRHRHRGVTTDGWEMRWARAWAERDSGTRPEEFPDPPTTTE